MNDSFKFNLETEFVPILGLVASQLNVTSDGSKAAAEDAKSDQVSHGSRIQTNHHSALLSLLANELKVQSDDIHDFELYVFDPSTS